MIRPQQRLEFGENLIKATPYYNYALNLDYNKERTPSAGSAIFLHCFSGNLV